ncbi:MAG TPA: arginine--tRNA ligase [Chloroflexota bacterium]|nr:arginine--tRNA ligase [Chloroflexota bacterium]
MIKHEIAELLGRAGQAAQDAGDLPAIALGTVPVERTSDPRRGDYASSIAMRLARSAGMPPLAIAQRLVRHLPPEAAIARVDVAPPGFINFGLSPSWLQSQVDAIVQQGDDFGRVDVGRGQSVQVEFVSANPTGFLNAANGRAGALGDALANVLDFANYRVEREYYVNDAGRQINAFYASVLARYKQAFGRAAEVPSDGYHGVDITTMAERIKAEHGDRFIEMPESEAVGAIGPIALGIVLDAVRTDLELLGVRYDRWYSERSLHQAGLVEQMIASLRERGHVAEREGAIWFTSSELGDERDHVLVRSNGTPTYLAADIAYHYDKLIVRKFDRVIDIWGADHHGHVAGLMAAVEAFGADRSRLTILLHQFVTLRRGGEIVRMSKRAGDYVALRDVIDEVGRDACRYFFLSRSANAHVEFDLELAKKESDENPVYYIQYSHARIASILRRAEGLNPREGDAALLTDDAELTLIRKMLQFPEVVEAAAAELEPHQLPYYARELAGVFTQFYEKCRVLDPDNPPRTLARLKLVLAAKTVLANCLRLMGMSAPERMERAD